MASFGETLEARRQTNARSLAAFGSAGALAAHEGVGRVIKDGQNATTVYTVGYEKRSGRELMEILEAAGVTVLADIRERPFSRVPAFRAGPLRRLCEEAGITYQGFPSLGSTEAQRARLKETGDFAAFAQEFGSYATAHMREPLAELAEVVRTAKVALLCYERSHDECHRSVIAARVARRTGASIIAL